LFPPGNGGCKGKIQEKKVLLVHDQKLQTMIEMHFLSSGSTPNSFWQMSSRLVIIFLIKKIPFYCWFLSKRGFKKTHLRRSAWFEKLGLGVKALKIAVFLQEKKQYKNNYFLFAI
jgi:hypothetical protein